MLLPDPGPGLFADPGVVTLLPLSRPPELAGTGLGVLTAEPVALAGLIRDCEDGIASVG